MDCLFLVLKGSNRGPSAATKRRMAMEPARWWTSEDVEVERGRFSKIRARRTVRNRLLYYPRADDGRCGQEVVVRKVHQSTHLGPLSSTA